MCQGSLPSVFLKPVKQATDLALLNKSHPSPPGKLDDQCLPDGLASKLIPVGILSKASRTLPFRAHSPASPRLPFHTITTALPAHHTAREPQISGMILASARKLG
ncbi:hypothetical protein ACJQWK_03397 [Exserohilum turcicum]